MNILQIGKICIPSQIIDNWFGWLYELIVDDDTSMEVDDADSRQLFAILCQTLSHFVSLEEKEFFGKQTHHLTIDSVDLLLPLL